MDFKEEEEQQHVEISPTATAPLTPNEENRDFNFSQHDYSDYRENHPPPRSICHKLFILQTILTSTTCLFLAITQLSLLLCAELGPISFTPTTWMYTLLQAFLPFFLVAFYFIEFEVDAPPILLGSVCLSNWIHRGFLYVFLGLILMDEHVNLKFEWEHQTSSSSSSVDVVSSLQQQQQQQESSSHLQDLRTYISFVDSMSMILFGLSRALLIEGMIYFLLGISCMRRVRDKCREIYRDQMESYHEMMRMRYQQV